MVIDWTTLPERMKALPVDPQRNVPIPWFVETLSDGTRDFRIMSGDHFVQAITERRCWVCGQGPLGRHLAFTVGPMCVVNRTNSEPPAHLECAQWSAKNCPFLSRPRMVRREGNLPDDVVLGEASLTRNPGATAVYVTGSYQSFRAPAMSATGWLIEMGPAERVEWYCEGRPATRDEVIAAIDSGLPALAAMCDKETDALLRMDARQALAQARVDVERLLPVG